MLVLSLLISKIPVWIHTKVLDPISKSFSCRKQLLTNKSTYFKTVQTSPLTLQYGFDQMDTYSEIMCICAMCVCLDDKNDCYDAFKFFLFSIIAVTVSEYIYMHMVSFLSFSRSID